MAQDVTKILVGAGVFSLSDYVAAAGAGTFTDLGYTLSPAELSTEYENFDVEVEQATGIVLTAPTKSNWSLKVELAQAEAIQMAIAMRQPLGAALIVGGNVSGTGANLTTMVGDAQGIYYQGKLVTKGPGTTGVRTLTFWRLQIASIDAIPYGKAAVQKLALTFRVLKDSSVSTNDKYWKSVDA